MPSAVGDIFCVKLLTWQCRHWKKNVAYVFRCEIPTRLFFIVNSLTRVPPLTRADELGGWGVGSDFFPKLWVRLEINSLKSE